MALWPSTPETSTLRDIIWDRIHKLKTVHYTFLLLPTPKGLRLAKHEFSKIILLWKKTISILLSFLKKQDVLFRNVNGLIFTLQPTRNWYF